MTAPEGPLQGRRLLVTGASSGIGLETVRLAVRQGATVVGVARRRVPIEDMAGVHAVTADLALPGEAERAVGEAVTHMGGLDLLVNNAAQYLVGAFEEGHVDDWRRMFDVNVLSVLSTVKAALPQLRQQPSDILNVSSLAGHRIARSSTAVYAASKQALRAITEGMRREFGNEHLRVMMVSPGVVDTHLGVGTRNPDDLAMIRDLQCQLGIKASDVAATIIDALCLPRRVTIRDVLVAPSAQAT